LSQERLSTADRSHSAQAASKSPENLEKSCHFQLEPVTADIENAARIIK
jgi:hypothetical protein